jgi:hypothetical protein
LPPIPISYNYDLLKRALPALEKIDRETGITEKEFFNEIGNVEYTEKDYFLSLIENIGDNLYTMSPFAAILWEDLKTKKGQVYISKNARKVYDESSGISRQQLNFYLDRITNPLWRLGKKHSFSSTDLDIYKMGNTAERVAAYSKGRDIYICEMFTKHDKYEKQLPLCKKENYINKENFTLFTFDNNELNNIPETEADIYQNLESKYQNLKKENSKLLDTIKTLKSSKSEILKNTKNQS